MHRYWNRSLFQDAAMKMISGSAALVFFIAVLGVPKAHAWWDGKWQARKKIQFDTSAKAADIKDNLTDVPVLVRLDTANFNFSGAKEDGSDLRFIGEDDKEPLKYHIEKFNPKDEIALIWVKVPRIAGGSNQDFIWMYYGNSTARDGQDMTGTYDVNQVAVYHFAEKEGSPQDSTAYKNNASSFTGMLGIPAVIGNGAQFIDPGASMKIAKSPSFNFVKGFTFSAWVRPDRLEGDMEVFSWDDGTQSIVIGIDGDKPYCSMSAGRGRNVATPKTASLPAKAWSLLAVTIEPDKEVKLYLNGNEVTSSKIKMTVPAPNTDMFLAASSKGGSQYFGDLDEIQLSNIARPAGWMKVAFQGQGPDGLLTSYLEEESGGGGGGESLTIHLMKIIVRTITLDGWLIIGFLIIMGCSSVFIFQKKVMNLNQAKKGNEAFSRSFRALNHPLELLEKEDEFAGSSLYRVYQAGCEELKECCDQPLKTGQALSVRAMNGFRAAVEKEAMYESRRLSAGMVIMNMSVAGGPFLGLLGTVWGVMNTFASLAESGEANLTAIAPGVASALACTLCGLLVAIPSLFASSYVTSRIKDMNADVNVFIDDFILRIEERK